jgi:hypothetical protein
MRFNTFEAIQILCEEPAPTLAIEAPILIIE